MEASLDSLRTFLKVFELRSFSLAARALYKSQSTVSTQIALLEDQTGIRFFDRLKRPLNPTAAGVIFHQFASEIVNKSNEVAKSLSELASGTAGEVRIGASTSIGSYMLPTIIGAILNRSPKLKISVLAKSRALVYGHVRNAEVSFAVVLGDGVPQALTGKPLRDEPFCFVVSEKHPLAGKKIARLEKLHSIPVVIGLEGEEYSEMVLRMLKEKGLSNYQAGTRISSLEGKKYAVRAGIGIGVLPRFTVRDELRSGALREVWVPRISLTASIMMIERPRHLLSPSALSVKQSIEKIISKRPRRGLA